MKSIQLLTSLKKLFFRHRQTLGNRVEHNKVNLEYFQEHINIGDQLAPVIFNWMLQKYGITNRCSGIKHLNTIGSIIGFKKYDAVIWGSGILSFGYAKSVFKFGRLIKYDIRAVRGPFTQEIMSLAGHDAPYVYGDPGILMPFIYPAPENQEKCYDVSVIHHYEAAARSQTAFADLHRINVETSDYQYVIDEILRSRLVISSSLHGIILAEAYGVPAIFLNENMDWSLLKFLDWYHSTGRTEIKIAQSIEDALQMTPMPLPDLSNMQQQLIEAFPRDIFC